MAEYGIAKQGGGEMTAYVSSQSTQAAVPADTSVPAYEYPIILGKLTGKRCNNALIKNEVMTVLPKHRLELINQDEVFEFLVGVFGKENVSNKVDGMYIKPAGMAAFCARHHGQIPESLNEMARQAFKKQDDSPIPQLDDAAQKKEDALQQHKANQLAALLESNWELPAIMPDNANLILQLEVPTAITGMKWSLAPGAGKDMAKLEPKLEENDSRRPIVKSLLKKAFEKDGEVFLSSSAAEHYAPRAGGHKILRALTNGRHWRYKEEAEINGRTQSIYLPLPLAKDTPDTNGQLLRQMQDVFSEGVLRLKGTIAVTPQAIKQYQDTLELLDEWQRLVPDVKWRPCVREYAKDARKDAFIAEMSAEEASRLRQTVNDVFYDEKNKVAFVWADAAEEYKKAHSRRNNNHIPYEQDPSELVIIDQQEEKPSHTTYVNRNSSSRGR